jgi:SET domain-containing protein
MKNEKPKLVVKRSKSGLGMFAASDIAKETLLIEYTGKLCSYDDANAKGRYLFGITSRLLVDGSTRKNKARYINHSCKPNCEPRIKNKRVFVYAVKNIKAGEELNYNYGREYFNMFIKPAGCKCAYCLNKPKK